MGVSEVTDRWFISVVESFFEHDSWSRKYINYLDSYKAVPTHVVKQTTSWSEPGKNIWSYIGSIAQNKAAAIPSSLSTPISENFLLTFLEEAFAVLGQHVRLACTAIIKEWRELTEGDGTIERVLAVLLGYAIAAFLAALYLNTFTVGNVRSAGRAIRSAIRQQMVVLKVAIFLRRHYAVFTCTTRSLSL